MPKQGKKCEKEERPAQISILESPLQWQWSSSQAHSHSWFQMESVKGIRNVLIGDYYASSKRYSFKAEKVQFPFGNKKVAEC